MKNSCGHSLKSQKLLHSNDFSCNAHSQRKIDNKSITKKIRNESNSCLEQIEGDICGPVHPSCESFRYFMILIYASTRWSHICLLSTCNQTFAKLLAQLRTHFSDYPIKKNCFDDADEFTSHNFYEYNISIGIVVEHLLTHFILKMNL